MYYNVCHINNRSDSVAQLVEHRIPVPKVVSSSLARVITFGLESTFVQLLFRLCIAATSSFCSLSSPDNIVFAIFSTQLRFGIAHAMSSKLLCWSCIPPPTFAYIPQKRGQTQHTTTHSTVCCLNHPNCNIDTRHFVFAPPLCVTTISQRWH